VESAPFVATLEKTLPAAVTCAGWEVIAQRSDGSVAATRGATTLRATPGQYLRESGPGPTRSGDLVSVRVGGGGSGVQPGWFYRFGTHPGDDLTVRSTCRLYLNLDLWAASEFLRGCAVFDSRQVPFLAKVCSSPLGYTRRDSGVLYLPSRYLFAALDAIAELYHIVAPGLAATVPPLTRCIAPGLSIAESPGDGLSFGESRCRLLAAVSHEAWQDQVAEAELQGRLEDALDATGIDPLRPHLDDPSDRYGIDEAAGCLGELIVRGESR
jgi:hypothetical protein